jgi:hypothetical protein
MTTPSSARPLRSIGALTLVATATLLIALGTLALVSAPAGAADSCGTYSFGFEGTRLLNDGISNTAGPFPADIPAGTYTVTLVSHDHHDTQVDVPTQPGEQYHVVLDSGYVSPASNDIPDAANGMTTVFTGQQIDASTEIGVRHGGAQGINSVDVVCVGFTLEATVESVVEFPAVEEPAVEEPTPTREAVEPEQDISVPLTLTRDPEVVARAAVEPEVKGIVQSQQPVVAQLAITGPSTQAVTLLIVGFVLIALGALLTREGKRA